MGNCWISFQLMADKKKVCDDLMIINLYGGIGFYPCYNLNLTGIHMDVPKSYEMDLEAV